MSCRFNFSDRSLIAILLYLYAMAVKYEYIGKIYFKICFKNRLLMRMKKVNQLFYENIREFYENFVVANNFRREPVLTV